MITAFGLVMHGEGWTIEDNNIRVAEGKTLHLYPPIDGNGVVRGQEISENGLTPRDGYQNACFEGRWERET